MAAAPPPADGGPKFPPAVWLNVFQFLDDGGAGSNNRIFHLRPIKEYSKRYQPAPVPRTRDRAFWNTIPAQYFNVLQVNRNDTPAVASSDTVGANLFQIPPTAGNPNSGSQGVFFTYATDILYLDWDYISTFLHWLAEGQALYLKDNETWEKNARFSWYANTPKPIQDEYVPDLVPAIDKDVRAGVQHIGLPIEAVWYDALTAAIIDAVYRDFPGVKYFWFYASRAAPRPADADASGAWMETSTLSMAEKRWLGVRKAYRATEDTTRVGRVLYTHQPAKSLKNANRLLEKGRWKERDPDCRPARFSFRALELFLDSQTSSNLKVLDSNSDMDYDSDLEKLTLAPVKP
ncbi:hypothetical protein QBC47DRAFT_461879 [Echria macrotheca]|uniref:Uncharacterized protein n=1 Tax=Echria macrotheca TaxID=438768 RepID=A0AAJ0FA73_9PEZI|nr:hypothetical protein QBC47DRAFT_461879 [Echria macrotheca]